MTSFHLLLVFHQKKMTSFHLLFIFFWSLPILMPSYPSCCYMKPILMPFYVMLCHIKRSYCLQFFLSSSRAMPLYGPCPWRREHHQHQQHRRQMSTSFSFASPARPVPNPTSLFHPISGFPRIPGAWPLLSCPHRRPSSWSSSPLLILV